MVEHVHFMRRTKKSKQPLEYFLVKIASRHKIMPFRPKHASKQRICDLRIDTDSDVSQGFRRAVQQQRAHSQKFRLTSVDMCFVQNSNRTAAVVVTK